MRGAREIDPHEHAAMHGDPGAVCRDRPGRVDRPVHLDVRDFDPPPPSWRRISFGWLIVLPAIVVFLHWCGGIR